MIKTRKQLVASMSMSEPPPAMPESTQLPAEIPKLATANGLPFDILIQIFNEYQSQEAPAHPTETLLLVCKSWFLTAVDHSSLWTSFKIHSDDFEFWCRIIPRRLIRCPPDSLLDIDIEIANMNYSPLGKLSSRPDKHRDKIMDLLTGPEGRGARRWRRLSINDRGPNRFSDYNYWGTGSRISWYLHFPTPNLQELHLTGLASNSLVLPSTPALRIFSAHHVRIEPFPDFTTAVEVDLTLGWDYDMALSNAVNLVKLKLSLGFGKGYQLSTSHPCLTSLALPEGLNEDGLNDFSAPALRELSLSFANGSEYRTVVNCNGIPLHRIQRLSIQHGFPSITPILDLVPVVRELLHAANQVRSLEIYGSVSRAVVLKVLQADCESLYQEHVVRIRTAECEMELGQGEDRRSSVEVLSRLLQKRRTRA
jgi:hypothetical protein